MNLGSMGPMGPSMGRSQNIATQQHGQMNMQNMQDMYGDPRSFVNDPQLNQMYQNHQLQASDPQAWNRQQLTQNSPFGQWNPFQNSTKGGVSGVVK